jgi:hypothetical protein
MTSEITFEQVYTVSDEVVAREIEGELIIVPLTSAVGNMEDELYTLTESGRAIWRLLDGLRSLQQIAQILTNEYDGPIEEIEQDVLGLVSELVRRRMLVLVS